MSEPPLVSCTQKRTAFPPLAVDTEYRQATESQFCSIYAAVLFPFWIEAVVKAAIEPPERVMSRVCVFKEIVGNAVVDFEAFQKNREEKAEVRLEPATQEPA